MNGNPESNVNPEQSKCNDFLKIMFQYCVHYKIFTKIMLMNCDSISRVVSATSAKITKIEAKFMDGGFVSQNLINFIL